jgi:predicted nucleotidyltransferase
MDLLHAGSEARERRLRAIEGARAAVAALNELGVAALVTGSLARGRFGLHSDVDLLITSCPRSRKYAIEGVVEDALGGLPFDVIYLDEIPAHRRDEFVAGAADARDLR